MAKGPSELRQMQAMLGKYLNEISEIKKDVRDLKIRMQRIEKHLNIRDEGHSPTTTANSSSVPSVIKF